MDKEKKIVKAKIDAILDKEILDISLSDSWSININRPRNVVGDKIIYENSDLLIELLKNLESTDLEGYNYWLNYLIDIYKYRRDDFSSLSAIYFYTLYRLGKENEIIETFLSKYDWYYFVLVCFFCDRIGVLSKFLNFEFLWILKKIVEKSIFFRKRKQITKYYWQVHDEKIIEEQLESWHEKEDVLRKIVKYRFERVKEEIQKFNIEINQDQKLVQEKISMLWLNNDYSQALEEIWKYILNENDKIVNSWLIWKFRELMGGIIKDIAQEIVKLTWDPLPPPKDKKEQTIWKSRRHLKEKFKLSNKDDKLIDDYVDIVNGEWSHALLSTKEYFRLTRNIGIELILFLLYKFEEFKKDYKK